MGIFSRFRSDDEPGAEPGAVSQPDGDGPVTLGDRIEPGGEGSPDTNQAKAEPMPPGGADPLAAPELSSMNVGAGDPQAPRHDAVPASAPGAHGDPSAPPPARRDLSGPGSTPDEQRPEIDTETSTGRSGGPIRPEQRTTGTSHRAPGLQGSTPDGEEIEMDAAAGAAQAEASLAGTTEAKGDAASVPAVGDGAAPGTSEQQPRVQGTILPPA